MKIILGTEAIRHPLTGIGRYSLELARGVPRDRRVAACRYFSYGYFVKQPGAGLAEPDGITTLARLAQLPPLAAVYQRVSPAWYGWRLRDMGDHIFHAPNYLVPPVRGPAVATIHDLSTIRYPHFHPKLRVRRMEAELPKTMGRADRIITVSEFVRHEVVQTLGADPARVVTICNGVDPMFRPLGADKTQDTLARLGLVHGRYILSVSTIEPRKNIGTLLDAYLGLSPTLRNRVPLVIAGATGWLSEDLHKRLMDAAQHGVRYLRYVDEADLVALYAGATLFALASLYEGYGLPVLEAMACGIPVIVSDAGSLPEVAGAGALKVNPLDVDAWREAIERGIQDEPWRLCSANTGRALARLASWERCVRSTVDLYESIAAS